MIKEPMVERYLRGSSTVEEQFSGQRDAKSTEPTLLSRIIRHPALMHYNRLIALVILINLILVARGIGNGTLLSAQGFDLAGISRLALINFAVAILIRQQYVINLLFWLATRAPTSWPLSIRWTLGKVYHFGGIHVGGAIAGTLWFLLFAGGLTYNRVTEATNVSTPIMAVTYVLLALLLLMVITALPGMRMRHHDRFERVHRLGGWTALLLFWIQTILFVWEQSNPSSVGDLLSAPEIWVLIGLSVSIVLPWLRLRRVAVEIERPSSHVALVRFDYGVTPFAGSSTAISRAPFLEWHSFANVPSPSEEGFRLTISRAGDWTGALIDDLPSHLWVKGIPTAGVANIETLFKRVIYVATGSGIGPCLPHLLAREVPARLLWSTRTPRLTYGDELVDEILAVQPDALIWDTSEEGKPDMVELTLRMVREFDAEAVICISNKKLTWQIVYGMEIRGIPAYGAIWDS